MGNETSPQPSDTSPRGLALAQCQQHIEFYDEAKWRQRIAYQSFQAAVIVLSGLTPILILWSNLCEALQALPSALAAIAAGLLGIFQWRANYVRFAYVCEALKSERLKFETRTTADYDKGLDDHVALSNFVARMERIVMREVSDWRAEMQKTAQDGKPGDSEK